MDCEVRFHDVASMILYVFPLLTMHVWLYMRKDGQLNRRVEG